MATKRIYKNWMSNYSKFVLTEQKLKETDSRELVAEKPNAIAALFVLVDEMDINDLALIDGHNLNSREVENLLSKLKREFAAR